MSDILHFQAECVKIESKPHKAVRVVFDSQEELTDEVRASIMAWHEKLGHLTFLQEKPIEALDALKLPPLTKVEGKKSKAKELRDAIWVWGNQRGEKDGEEFYEKIMKSFINHVKEKLV